MWAIKQDQSGPTANLSHKILRRHSHLNFVDKSIRTLRVLLRIKALSMNTGRKGEGKERFQVLPYSSCMRIQIPTPSSLEILSLSSRCHQLLSLLNL